MPQKRICILFVISLSGICFLPLSSSAQNSYRYPVSFGHYMTSYFTVNPAYDLSGSQAQLSLGNQEYIGPLRRVKSYYVYAGLNLSKEERNTKSVAAIFASNEKDGGYVGRSKLYFNYSWHTKVKENLWLAAGAYLGFINYSFEGANNTAGGSDLGPDGSLGISVYNEDLHIGLSGNQVFNSILQPIVGVYQFPIYYNLTLHKSFDVSPNFRVRPSSLVTLKWEEKKLDYNFGLLTTLQNKIIVGGNYRHQQVVSFLLGIQNLKVNNHFFNFNFTYNQPSERSPSFNLWSFPSLIYISNNTFF